MNKDLFFAISDPTRREILSIISSRSLNIGSVAENFAISRTAIYKHIKILTDCGLIKIKKQGRKRYCEARLYKLQKVSDWIQQYGKSEIRDQKSVGQKSESEISRFRKSEVRRQSQEDRSQK